MLKRSFIVGFFATGASQEMGMDFGRLRSEFLYVYLEDVAACFAYKRSSNLIATGIEDLIL
jgi:hypothetical protein